MNVNISFPDRLDLFHCQKEFFIKLFIQFVEDQTALCGYQRTVSVAVFFIPDIHDGLALFIYFIQHLYKVLFVITIITITFCHHRIYLFQGSLYHIMHLCNRDVLNSQCLYLFFYETTDIVQLLICEFNECTVRRFINSHNYFLHVKIFLCPVFLDDSDHTTSAPFAFVLSIFSVFITQDKLYHVSATNMLSL